MSTTTRPSGGSLGEPGSGAGKAGSSGGTIRDAGGPLGKRAVAKEEEYFWKQQKAQLKVLKEELAKEVKHHEDEMIESDLKAKHHTEVITKHKKRIAELEQAMDEEKHIKDMV